MHIHTTVYKDSKTAYLNVVGFLGDVLVPMLLSWQCWESCILWEVCGHCLGVDSSGGRDPRGAGGERVRGGVAVMERYGLTLSLCVN